VTVDVRPVQQMQHSLAAVAEQLAAEPPAGSAADVVVSGVSQNTPLVRPGDLFVALPGARAHGADFAAEAIAGGAVAMVTDQDGATRGIDLPTVTVSDPRSRLADLSAWFYGRPAEAFRTIGVTGTQGKTTATYLAEAALGTHRSAVVGTIGTRINRTSVASTLTTPEAPELQALFAVMREEQVEACAMEVSSHALVLGRVDGVVFDTAVFLNLGRDHLDFHLDLEDYFLAKAALFAPDRTRHAVINVDDEHGRALVDLVAGRVPTTTFSTTGRPSDWRAVNIRPHRSGTDVDVLGPDARAIPLTIPLPGAFNVSNALAVLAALSTAGFDSEELAAGIAESPGVPGRMESFDAGQEFTAVVDYAHKPDAVTAVLSALRPVTPGRLIIVIGAGGDRDHGKRPLMGEAAAKLADVVIVTDDNPRSENPDAIRAAVLDGTAPGPGVAVEIGDRRQAIGHAVAMARRGDTVVVAGKGHERGQEIGGTVHPFEDRAELESAIAASLGGSA
jgi:UDP-N-acetylmuramoyl-L-alanyl-D-glutamate--2,6-diaminopimelate ligase